MGDNEMVVWVVMQVLPTGQHYGPVEFSLSRDVAEERAVTIGQNSGLGWAVVPAENVPKMDELMGNFEQADGWEFWPLLRTWAHRL